MWIRWGLIRLWPPISTPYSADCDSDGFTRLSLGDNGRRITCLRYVSKLFTELIIRLWKTPRSSGKLDRIGWNAWNEISGLKKKNLKMLKSNLDCGRASIWLHSAGVAHQTLGCKRLVVPVCERWLAPANCECFPTDECSPKGIFKGLPAPQEPPLVIPLHRANSSPLSAFLFPNIHVCLSASPLVISDVKKVHGRAGGSLFNQRQ